MIRAAILSLAFLITGIGSASAGECGKLCTSDWWKGDPTQEEVAAEIATVDVKARDEDGSTPLHWTAEGGTPANITALLKAGADINAKNRPSRTPLHKAAIEDNPAIVIALLDARADGRAEDKRGQTPFDLAKENKKLKGTDAYWAEVAWFV